MQDRILCCSHLISELQGSLSGLRLITAVVENWTSEGMIFEHLKLLLRADGTIVGYLILWL